MSKSPETVSAFIGLGSNLGEPPAQLRRAARGLEALGNVVGRSSLYKTDPVGGPAGQEAYLNAVVALDPHPAYKKPHALLAELLALEQRQGRERRERWGPRTLDLDLLLMGERVVDTKTLTLPHPRMMTRAFVLVPLCEVLQELNLELRHPRTGQVLCGAFERSGVNKTGLEW